MFITFEGPEGAGKSTLIPMVSAWLQAQGIKVLATREPGSGPLGPALRAMLLDSPNLSVESELLLFLADRSQHVHQWIRPALARGDFVICDRYADSTIVYQGYGRGLDIEQLRDWNRFATGGLVPDQTFLLDIDPEVGLARQLDADRMGSETIEFHRRVRNGFLTEAEREPDRWTVIDAHRSIQQVLAEVQAILNRSLY
jgi:dTMP kinase